MAVLTPFILINFCLDYLSDSQITHSETELGMHQLFHHLVATIWAGIYTLPFMSSKLTVITVSVLVSIVIQGGHLMNKDYCWLTRRVNRKINSDKPDRKWVGGDIVSLMKKYVRGDDWAYSNMGVQKNRKLDCIVNCIHFGILFKILIKGNKL